MNVFPLFSTPVTLSMNNIDMMFYEIETIKRESFHEHRIPLDGLSTDNRSVLLKYPNLLNVVHKHIKKSLYDELENQFENEDPLDVISDFKAFITAFNEKVFDSNNPIDYSFFYLRWSIYW